MRLFGSEWDVRTANIRAHLLDEYLSFVFRGHHVDDPPNAHVFRLF